MKSESESHSVRTPPRQDAHHVCGLKRWGFCLGGQFGQPWQPPDFPQNPSGTTAWKRAQSIKRFPRPADKGREQASIPASPV